MAGLASLLELLSKEGSSIVFPSSGAVHSFASLSALSAASAAASTVGILPLYVPSSFFRDNVGSIAHCEALNDDVTDWEAYPASDEDIDLGKISADELYRRAYANKSYHVPLKPIYSAFYPGALSLTVLRALAVNFQSVMEAYLSRLQEDDEEEEFSEEEPIPIDVEAALKGSGWTISREVTVVTTRRLLERLVVQHVSKRTAWKLLKDLPTSARRKSGRLLPKLELLVAVTKTTFKGQLLGSAASWLVQLLIDIYSYIRALYRRRRKTQTGDGCQIDYQVELEELAFFLRKVVGNTLKCAAALALSSVGAGIGVVLMRPSWGQWLGCIAGEVAGVVGMSYLIDRWIIYGTLGQPDLD